MQLMDLEPPTETANMSQLNFRGISLLQLVSTNVDRDNEDSKFVKRWCRGKDLYGLEKVGRYEVINITKVYVQTKGQ